MTLEQLNSIIDAGNVDQLIGVLSTHKIVKEIEDIVKQYDPKQHAIFDKSKRIDKIIKDNAGNTADVVKVSRIPLAIQKKIVLTATAFMGTPTIQATPQSPKEKDFLTLQRKVWDDNKIQYKFNQLVKKTKSEKQSAELWFTQKADVDYWKGFPIRANATYKFRMKTLAASLGDDLYPVFDDFGDMVAFGRGYKILDEKGKDVNCFDIYTAERFYFTKQVDGAWQYFNGTDYVTNVTFQANPFGKIPIIYYYQPLTDWDDVQELIDRLETKISNHADTNNYFDSPILVGIGDTITLPVQGEAGKYVEIKGAGGDLKYLTWDQSPESMKLEMDNLKSWIFSLTQTPDISFDNLKSLGYFSTVALKTIFADAHIKAADSEEIFGEGVQRRINYLKHAIAKIDTSFVSVLPMDMKAKFDYFLPQNIEEIVNTLTRAVEGGIMTTETAVRENPLVTDADTEIEELKKITDAKPQIPPTPPIPPTNET